VFFVIPAGEAGGNNREKQNLKSNLKVPLGCVFQQRK
jgi:hypothetical protein